jgi:hypothetical protein
MLATERSRHLLPGILIFSLVLVACSGDGTDVPDVPRDTIDVAVSPDATDIDVVPDAGLPDAMDLDVTAPLDPGAQDPGADIDAETEPDAPEEVSQTAYKELPVAACGMPAYELVDPATLGEVLAWEEIPLWDMTAEMLNALLAETDYGDFQVLYGAKVFRMRYTTQDRGQVVEATAVVAVPQGDGLPQGPLPIILHTHGTTGFVDECAPSHPDNALTLSAVPALMSAMGYVFVGPDYIGMNGFGEPATVRHAYLGGEQVAIGSWDAVRAARRALLSELAPAVETAPRVIPWGESQGGHAAFFVDLYAPYYAPEFDVPAVVALVGPPNLLPVLQYATAELGPGSGLAMVSLVALNEWFGRQAPIDGILTNAEPIFLADNVLAAIYPEGKCSTKAPSVETIDQIFDTTALAHIAAAQWEQLLPWSCYYAQNSLPTTDVKPRRFVPMLMVYGEDDDLVLPEVGRQGVADLCDLGWQIEHVECAGAGHTEAAVLSLNRQFDWVAARLAGEPIDPERLCEPQAPEPCVLGNGESSR